MLGPVLFRESAALRALQWMDATPCPMAHVVGINCQVGPPPQPVLRNPPRKSPHGCHSAVLLSLHQRPGATAGPACLLSFRILRLLLARRWCTLRGPQPPRGCPPWQGQALLPRSSADLLPSVKTPLVGLRSMTCHCGAWTKCPEFSNSACLPMRHNI